MTTPDRLAAPSGPDGAPGAENTAPGPVDLATRVTLSISEACGALGISWDTWHSMVEPDIRLIRIGRRKLVAVDELRRWAAESGERTLG